MSGFLGVCLSLIVFAFAVMWILCVVAIIVMVIRAIKKHKNEMKKYRRCNMKQNNRVMIKKAKLENLIRRSFQLDAVQKYLDIDDIVRDVCLMEKSKIDEMVKKKMEEFS